MKKVHANSCLIEMSELDSTNFIFTAYQGEYTAFAFTDDITCRVQYMLDFRVKSERSETSLYLMQKENLAINLLETLYSL